jgi:signal transduction histidine kinase
LKIVRPTFASGSMENQAAAAGKMADQIEPRSIAMDVNHHVVLRLASHSTTESAGFTRSSKVDAYSEVRLAERKRIAQELHDTVLQGFLSVSMRLHAALDHLPANCATAKTRFTDVLELLDRVLEQARSAVENLHSPDDHNFSLGDALGRRSGRIGFAAAGRLSSDRTW